MKTPGHRAGFLLPYSSLGSISTASTNLITMRPPN
nr:MAG TPA: hypothetical protein [Caudoviricetes sp.]